MSYGSENEMSRWQKFKRRLKDNYRLVVMNNETFEEVSSITISLLNIWILTSTIIVVVAAIVVSLIFFTPLKRYIPGYAVGNDPRVVFQLTEEIEALEKQLASQMKYTNNVRKVLVGGAFQTVEEAEAALKPKEDTLQFIKPVAQSPVDEQIREEIEYEAINNLVQEGTIENTSPFKPIEQLFFSSPVSGEITAPFEPEKNHFGVDISSPKNTPVKAALDGYIFFSDWTVETGNTVGIQHDNNIITFYKHNSALLKKIGNQVKAGEAVAIIGNTGTLSTGPHLHFELWQNGKPVNPINYIGF